MNAREFLNAFKDDECERVAVEAGTTLAYFKQLAYGARWPSRKLAHRLIAASRGRLDLAALMPPEPLGDHVDDDERTTE